MNELDRFKAHILGRTPMSPEALDELAGAFLVKKVKKKQFVIQPDFPVKYRNWVAQGAFRSYVIDQHGVDHTIQFAVEDWWIGDLNSYFRREPAQLFVVALEDSVIFQIDYDTEARLKAAQHVFETFFRISAERTAAFHQRRIISSLTHTAEERYNEFIATYPDVVQRLPQYALASYLGMTTQFLSRIRKAQLRKKE